MNAMEIYFAYFVPLCLQPGCSIEGFRKHKADVVINFNYTDTYRKIYGDVDCLFIHGKADEEVGKNIVHGIDEFLPDDKKEEQIAFIEYRKFYQRLHKKTDYTSMRRHLSAKTREKQVAVFYGHSMSELDKEVLLELLPVKDDSMISKAIICSYDNASRKRQIAELVRILGMNLLTELMSGEDPKIEMILNDELEQKLDDIKEIERVANIVAGDS